MTADLKRLAPGEADGDVRYDAATTGYCRRRRGRLRETERQVALLVTSTARDNGSAGTELQDERLASAIREVGTTIREYRGHRRAPADVRPALVHLAAVAILWAEASDAPPELRGPRLSRSHRARVVRQPVRVAPVLAPEVTARPVPPVVAATVAEKRKKRPQRPSPRRLRAVPVAEGQISLLEEAA